MGGYSLRHKLEYGIYQREGMKLYATVTSERASKGQGGNREVVINLKIDPKARIEVGNLVMSCENDVYTIYYYPINQNCTDQEIKGGRVLLYETKGEKQKGEKCPTCFAQYSEKTMWCEHCKHLK